MTYLIKKSKKSKNQKNITQLLYFIFKSTLRAGSNGKYAFRKYVFCKAYFGKGVGSYGKEYSAEIEMHANLFLD